jgi:hypothetical protein
MTAVLDASALLLAVVDTKCRRQARSTFAMARHAVADMVLVLDRKPIPPNPDRLPPSELVRLREALADARICLRPSAEAGPRLAELRAMYEPAVAALSALLEMPLPPWVPLASRREDRVAHF